jgi:hypothetical protein
LRRTDGHQMKKDPALEIRFPLRARRNNWSLHPEATPPTTAGLLPRITQVLALAIRFDDMIQRGEAKDYSDVSRLFGLCRERVSQIARLNYLAPDIQIELLYLPPTPTGRYPISETAVRSIASTLSWVDQRRDWSEMKKRHKMTK